MQFGINLLPRPKKPPGLGSKTLQKIKLLAGAILIVYIIFLAALFTFSFYISSSEAKLKQELSQIETKVKGLQKRESLEITLKERVGEASRILEASQKTRQAGASQVQLISRVQSLILPGISLGTIEVVPGELVFSGEASNFKVLGDFLDQFRQPASGWSWVRLDSLSRLASGIYSFSLKSQPEQQ